MEPRFNTSFIPKKPVVETLATSVSSRASTRNIFSVTATVLFIATILTFGGLFFYKNYIQSQIAQADKEINEARVAFELDKIQDLLNANSRILAIKNLLEKHFTVSRLFTLLEELTIKRFRIGTMTYENKLGSPTVTLTGETQTYNSLAQQSEILSQSEFIKELKFSNFGLVDNGNIRVSISASIEPVLVSYKKALESLSLSQ